MATQRIQAFSITDTGRKRSNNQDACAVFKKQDFLLMVVADGVGGNMCGEVASQIAVQTFRQYFDRVTDLNPKSFLEQAAVAANQSIRDHVTSHPECKGMATTLTAALVRYPNLHILQIGDSRAYLLRNGILRRLTEDHTLVRKMVKEGLLTKEEARTHPKRHVIINALGISRDQKFDYFKVELKQHDQILLCSDGLYDELPENEMRELLLENDPKEAIQRLVAAANAAGGRDNISITLAALDGKKMGDTKQFEAGLPPRKQRNRLMIWLIILLCLFVFAGGFWYLGRSTETGKKVISYISTLFGKGDVLKEAETPQGEKPRGTD
ncbi:MAG: Stp1/IreP family PP2C-type Ser/Thr phosphatase [Deltaproteobacteria bacterium]|nr:Stp1/IreP family PP2C-type Ser/Thr phosphatase [Deltaproteobacteria bacterium]